MRNWLLFVIFCCLESVVLGQQTERIVFYNVENLFDTKDDPLKQDDEFTPKGKKHWTNVRYMTKLRCLADAVKVAGGTKLPLVLGMAEVENRKVLDDLISKTLLIEGNYEIVHQDGPDNRGIDVALLFCQNKIQLLASHFYPIYFSEDTTIKTRDVLYAKMLYHVDTLHFFVCHFPSMVGGEKQSEWKREKVATLVREKVDSLFQLNVEAKILIMGDLNGKANTWTQREILKSKKIGRVLKSGELYNPGYYLLKENAIGTYRYRGNWQTIDHIIVSSGLLTDKIGCQVERRIQICSDAFLLEEDKSHFGYKPCPTFRGMRYVGGSSDHLPIYIVINEGDKNKRMEKLTNH